MNWKKTKKTKKKQKTKNKKKKNKTKQNKTKKNKKQKTKQNKITCEINITFSWVQMPNIPNLFPYTLGLSSVSQKTTLSKISTKGSKIKTQEMFLENTISKHYTSNYCKVNILCL